MVVSGGAAMGNALNNTVSITGGDIAGITNGGQVFGGNSQEGDADFNTVSISGGLVKNYVVGGFSQSGGSASYNTVTLSGDAIVDNQVFSGSNDVGLSSIGSGNVSYNIFYISDNAQVTNHVRNVAASGDAIYNTFIIEGGTVFAISGSAASVGNSQNNSVFMTGGTVTSYVASGWVSNMIAGEGGDVSKNTVTIGGTGHVGGGRLGWLD